MTELPAVFDRNRYAVVKSLLGDPDLSQTYQYVCAITAAGLMKDGDRLVPHVACRYGDPLTDGLLLKLQPAIEQATGLSLYPTYSYVRLYKNGDALTKHTDRESCEISVTLCLGMKPDAPWPIHVEGPHGSSGIELNPGDALLYRGIECAHWRTAYQGDQLGQLFLHYVDQQGPYAEWKFDRRPSLSGFDALTKDRDQS
jgi:hypothetical protein